MQQHSQDIAKEGADSPLVPPRIAMIVHWLLLHLAYKALGLPNTQPLNFWLLVV